jgi:ATP-dependent Clp protease ATP-binding subunit ClpA
MNISSEHSKQGRVEDAKYASDEALDYLVDKGFDSKMGARPLQRLIDKEIKQPLSRLMLFGSLKSGGTVCVNINSEHKLVLDTETHEQTQTI